MTKVVHRLKYSNTWLVVGRAVWEVMGPLGDGILLEKGHHGQLALMVYSILSFPACFLCFVFMVEDVISRLWLPVAVPLPTL